MFYLNFRDPRDLLVYQAKSDCQETPDHPESKVLEDSPEHRDKT